MKEKAKQTYKFSPELDMETLAKLNGNDILYVLEDLKNFITHSPAKIIQPLVSL